GTVHAPRKPGALLSRRPLPDAARRRRQLQRTLHPRPHRAGGARSGRVPEVALRTVLRVTRVAMAGDPEGKSMTWRVAVLVLGLLLLGGCSSGMGSAMTGPSSQSTNQPSGGSG